MKNNYMKSIILSLIIAFIALSCDENPVTTKELPIPEPPPPNVQAVYILNEGDFNDAEGARLTMYDITNDTLYKSVFETANEGKHLGGTGDDIKLIRGFMFILMSGSKNLEIVRLSNKLELNHKQTAEYYFSAIPHDLVIDTVRSKAYISQLYNNAIYVFDYGTVTLSDSITVGTNPQGMLLDGNQLFVCNSGFSKDSTVSVINVDSVSLITTITVGLGPVNLTRLPDHRIAVVCTGDTLVNGRISIINPATNAVDDVIELNERLYWGTGIASSSDGNVFVIGSVEGEDYGGPVHRVNIGTKAITKNFITGTYYSITLDAAKDELYVTDVKHFNANGEVLIYSKEGALIKSFEAEKGPATIVFKR